VSWTVLLAACSGAPATPPASDGSGDPAQEPGADPGPDPVDTDASAPTDPTDQGGTTWQAPTEADRQAPIGPPTTARTALPLSGDATEGSPMVLDATGQIAWVGDLDLGAVLRFDLSAGSFTVFPVGAEPTRLLRVGDALFVTLRGAGELVRLDVSGATPVEVDRVAVGAEPTDLVISADLQRLYVALSQEEAVLALDAPTLAPIGRFSVLGEPRWLALAGEGADERVVVASARLPRLREIAPAAGVLSSLDLPRVPRFADPACPQRDLAPRVTGDLAIDRSDDSLVVPLLLVDLLIDDAPVGLPPPPGRGTHTGDTGGSGGSDTFDDLVPFDTGSPLAGGCGEAPAPRGGGAYGRPADPITPGKPERFTPAVSVWTPGAAAPRVLAVGVTLTGAPGSVLRSYPSSVVVHGSELLVTAPGSGALARLHPDALVREDAGGLLPALREGVSISAGLDAVQVTPAGDLVTWSFLDRDVHVVDGDAALTQVPRRIDGPTSPLAPDLQLGRHLFYSATSPQMSASGSGVSCETCHLDGRTDGLTFVFADLPRQAPSLAGHVSDTTPITWLGTVATVVDEVHATSASRMGGTGPSDAQAQAVAAYVDSIRLPIRPVLPADAVARGEALFKRADVGCVTCHAGAARTDGRNWAVLGSEVALNTPTLRGIGGSAPYFHDGSAFTLRDVLERVKDGSMGHTGHLTDAQLDDLEAFLRSL
jgi:hypothetical protein